MLQILKKRSGFYHFFKCLTAALIIVALLAYVVWRFFTAEAAHHQTPVKPPQHVQQNKLTAKPTAPLSLPSPPTVQKKPDCKHHQSDLTQKHAIDEVILALHRQPNGLTAVKAQLKETLTPCQLDLAMRYLDYKNALALVAGDLTLAERLATLDALRQRYFSPQEYQAWFAQEQQWHLAMLERYNILSNSQLSDAQKQQQITQHIANLPQPQREIITASQQVHQLSHALKSHTLNYNDIAANYSPDIAERLIKAKDNQQQWQTKIIRYQQEKRHIVEKISDPNLRQQLLEEYKAQHFSKNERKRLAVIDEN